MANFLKLMRLAFLATVCMDLLVEIGIDSAIVCKDSTFLNKSDWYRLAVKGALY